MNRDQWRRKCARILSLPHERQPKPRERRPPDELAEHVVRLVRLGVPGDLARRLSKHQAILMIERMEAHTETPRESEVRTWPGAHIPPVFPLPPEEGEANDIQIKVIAQQKGKWGSHHRKK